MRSLIKTGMMAVIVIFLVACSEKPRPKCNDGFKRYTVYMYEASTIGEGGDYLFIKKYPNKRYYYLLSTSTQAGAYKKLMDVYQKGVGYDLGVEANICGRLISGQKPYGIETMVIAQLDIVGEYEMDALIAKANEPWGAVPPTETGTIN